MDLIRKQWLTLIVIFISNVVMFMCFPSILFLHFTQIGHYRSVISSYPLEEQEAARNFLTIVPFFTVYAAQVIGRLLSPLIPGRCMDVVLSPILILCRLAIAGYLYSTLLNDLQL